MGSQSSLPFGAYVYGDFCTGEIFILNGGAASVRSNRLSISSLAKTKREISTRRS